MKPLFGHSEEVASFVASLVPGLERGFGNNQSIGILNNKNELVAGFVYHNWEPETAIIEISGASIGRWVTREILTLIYDYPFLVCKCQMVIQRNSALNEGLNDQLRRLGFNEYYIPRLKGRNEDGILFTMTDDQWAAHPMNLRNKRAA